MRNEPSSACGPLTLKVYNPPPGPFTLANYCMIYLAIIATIVAVNASTVWLVVTFWAFFAPIVWGVVVLLSVVFFTLYFFFFGPVEDIY